MTWNFSVKSFFRVTADSLLTSSTKIVSTYTDRILATSDEWMVRLVVMRNRRLRPSLNLFTTSVMEMRSISYSSQPPSLKQSKSSKTYGANYWATLCLMTFTEYAFLARSLARKHLKWLLKSVAFSCKRWARELKCVVLDTASHAQQRLSSMMQRTPKKSTTRN